MPRTFAGTDRTSGASCATRAAAITALAITAQERPRHAQHAPVVEADRLHAFGESGAAVGFAAREQVRRADALPLRVVQRQRQPQPLRPLAQRLRLFLARRVGAGQRALQQVGPSGHALALRRLDAGALVLEVRLHHPARYQREQRQRRQHGEVDAQVQRAQGQGPVQRRAAVVEQWRLEGAKEPQQVHSRRLNPACARKRTPRRAP
ncbi:MAG: hypothetical protein U1F25_09120 [Rubrivivax sp.]